MESPIDGVHSLSKTQNLAIGNKPPRSGTPRSSHPPSPKQTRNEVASFISHASAHNHDGMKTTHLPNGYVVNQNPFYEAALDNMQYEESTNITKCFDNSNKVKSKYASHNDVLNKVVETPHVEKVSAMETNSYSKNLKDCEEGRAVRLSYERGWEMGNSGKGKPERGGLAKWKGTWESGDEKQNGRNLIQASTQYFQ